MSDEITDQEVLDGQKLDDWIERIEHQLEGVEFFSVGGSSSCEECEHGGGVFHTISFSRSSCDSCRSGMAGERHPAHGIIDGDTHHFDVCAECLFFHANGDLPDPEHLD